MLLLVREESQAFAAAVSIARAISLYSKKTGGKAKGPLGVHVRVARAVQGTPFAGLDMALVQRTAVTLQMSLFFCSL